MSDSQSDLGRIESLAGRPLFQVALVVHDLERSLERYSTLLGAGPWRCYTFGPHMVPRLEYRGEPATFSMRLALNDQSPMLELIEPLEGPNIYEEWLQEHGESLHHVAVTVDSIADAIQAMADAGYPVLQAGYGFGVDGDGAFAYFDTQADFGLILEAVELPGRLREPDFVWPNGPEGGSR